MKNAFEELEFNKVKALISSHCMSPLGERLVEDLTPLTDKTLVEKKLSELQDVFNYLEQSHHFALSSLEDTEMLFDYFGKYEQFNIDQLLMFGSNIRIANTLKKDRDILPENFPELHAITSTLVEMKELENRFDNIFDSAGEIRDTASPMLSSIRKNKLKTRKRIYTELESILEKKDYENVIQEKVVTFRDERYVIPVREGGVTQMKGIVHGRSKTGASFYVEPLSVMELNNSLNTLSEEEKQEIHRILTELYNQLRDNKDALLQNLGILQIIDFLNACALYSRSIHAYMPAIIDDTRLSLKNARHPLLFNSIKDPNNIIPFSLLIGDEFRGIVISGVNTGGKTVTLKATGLLTMMALSGLMIPVEESQIGMFTSFFTDINDEQSIEDSISTFSSHIKKLNAIFDGADGSSLILIDELGTGTDPEEGAAFAQSVMEALIAKKSKVIITTHLNKLKMFASEHPLCENASMRFDQEKLQPTYQLDLGFPGNSYALDIAKEYHSPENIIARARELIDQKSLQLSELLKKTEQQRIHLSQKLYEFDLKNKLLEQQLESLNKKEQNWKQIEKERTQKALKDSEEYLSQLQREFDHEIDGLKKQFRAEKNIDHAKVHDVKNRISKERISIEKKQDDLSDIEFVPIKEVTVGKEVYIKPLKLVGKVHSVEKNTARVLAEGLTYNVKKTDLYEIPKGKELAEHKEDAEISIHADIDHDFAFELNLMGLTFDEARIQLDKYLDKAILLNYPKVRILHGKGTGQLRRKIWDYLKNDRRITEFNSAPLQEGGDGVTVVLLM
ncbi:MAG: endonuclease MutS2 [Candidatus Marinimicrobia bacterium]|nr:endonuclease MutS2 [Candidatus Neomarinimicrobiota bacterium]